VQWGPGCWCQVQWGRYWGQRQGVPGERWEREAKRAPVVCQRSAGDSARDSEAQEGKGQGEGPGASLAAADVAGASLAGA